jgi:hypothetical protein
MGTFSSWKHAGGGAYNTSADWNGGVPDSTTTEADLPTLASAYIVTSKSSETVDFLEVDPTATLSLTGGTYTVFASSTSYSNAYLLGTIDVGAGATIAFGQADSPSSDSAEINGGGTLLLSSNLAEASLDVLSPWMGLFNGARIKLNHNAQIVGATTGGGNTLENDSATISGSGTIGNGAGATGGNGLWLQNAADGIIDANGAAGYALVINTGTNAISNQGVLENTGAGGLTIASFMYQNGELIDTGTGELTLEAVDTGLGSATIAKGATLVLRNGGLSISGAIKVGSSAAPGGSITTSTGNLAAVGTNNDYVGDVLSDGEIDNTGTITVANNSTLNLNATIYNTSTGKVSIAGTTGPTTLEVFSNGLTIDGGTVVLSNSANNLIDSNGVGTQLSDWSTIEGAGTIGDTWLRLYVALGAAVRANDAIGMTIVGDSAAVTAGSESANYSAGTVETTGAGGLTIDGSFGNAGYLIAAGVGALTLNGAHVNTGGGITETTGAGSIVLENDAIITNQAYVTVSASGKISTTSGDSGDVLEASLNNSGAVNVANNSTLIVEGHWAGAGSVNLKGSTAETAIDIEAGQRWELIGGGTLNLGGVDNSILSGSGASSTNTTEFRNVSDTVKGSGTIGDAFMTINNTVGATIDATGAGGLILDATPYNTTNGDTYLNNGGTIESNSAGGLTIESTMFNSGKLIANTGGNIDAEDTVYAEGIVQINGKGSAEFGAELDNDVHFGAGGGGTLIFDNFGAQTPTESAFYGQIYGLAAGDSIDLRDFAFSAGNMALGSTSGFGILDGGISVTNGTSTSSDLYLEGNYTAAYLSKNHLAWNFVSDGHEIGTTGTFGTEIQLVSTISHPQ